ncbi:MAG: ATP-binding cassette domain-containing protein, partial [Richelia sp. SM2_1_7]|nr:ATP-binding cassette domain-containing protein [Richelia sp. SM2_1_7]
MQSVNFSPDDNSPNQERVYDIQDAVTLHNRSIKVAHVGVSYRSLEALVDINCIVKPGRLTGIYGPNGAGKSTLMKAMLGLVEHSGTISYQGKPLTEQLEKVAYVPQRSVIDWTYPATVWDVVMMGRVKKT